MPPVGLSEGRAADLSGVAKSARKTRLDGEGLEGDCIPLRDVGVCRGSPHENIVRIGEDVVTALDAKGAVVDIKLHDSARGRRLDSFAYRTDEFGLLGNLFAGSLTGFSGNPRVHDGNRESEGLAFYDFAFPVAENVLSRKHEVGATGGRFNPFGDLCCHVFEVVEGVGDKCAVQQAILDVFGGGNIARFGSAFRANEAVFTDEVVGYVHNVHKVVDGSLAGADAIGIERTGAGNGGLNLAFAVQVFEATRTCNLFGAAFRIADDIQLVAVALLSANIALAGRKIGAVLGEVFSREGGKDAVNGVEVGDDLEHDANPLVRLEGRKPLRLLYFTKTRT